jgi:hypothetical protein
VRSYSRPACGHQYSCLSSHIRLFNPRCLRSLLPSACPLCRKPFQSDRVKKLHLANPPELDNAEQEAIDAHASLLLQRIALVSGEDAPEADVVEVVTEVQEWLQSQPDDPNPVSRFTIANTTYTGPCCHYNFSHAAFLAYGPSSCRDFPSAIQSSSRSERA